MSIALTLDKIHSKVKENRWMQLFTIFNRLALAAGFIPAGIVKILDERFASGLSANHPMGHYLEALHLTGYYYYFIGIAQILAAILLLLPRTGILGAIIYFPIILNICILTFATRFDGSMFTAPLMTLSSLYLICWDYDKWKYIMPFNHLPNEISLPKEENSEKGIYNRLRIFLKNLFKDKFPFLFFAGVFLTMVFFVLIFPSLYNVRPRNTLPQCLRQFKDTSRTKAGETFCNCIHTNGEPLGKCLSEYNNSADDN